MGLFDVASNPNPLDHIKCNRKNKGKGIHGFLARKIAGDDCHDNGYWHCDANKLYADNSGENKKLA